MFVVKRLSSLLILLLSAVYLAGQVPVPNQRRDNNPYLGNPNLLPGETTEQADARTSIMDDRVYSDVFETGLPSFFREGNWRIRLNPKFGDFFDDDHVRFPVGLEYNFSDYFEGFFDVGTYFPNPAEDGDRWGTYNLRLGGKYSWWKIGGTDNNMSIGFNSDMPWSDPPIDVTDGWSRHEPYISFSRELGDDPARLVYLNVAYEIVSSSPFTSNPVSPRPKDRIFLRPGFIYYPGGNFRYSTEVEYRTSTFDSRAPMAVAYQDWVGTPEYTRAFETVHEVIVSPGVTWFPTEEFRKGFFVPGNWDIGVKLDIPIIEETDEDIGVSVRFRWYYDYDGYLKTRLRNLWPLGKGE